MWGPVVPVAGLLLLALAGCAPSAAPARSSPSRTLVARPTRTASPAASAGLPSLDDPASIDVVVNKRRPLRPATFVPPDLVVVATVARTNPPQLRRPAATALVALVRAAGSAGLRLRSISAYRSYSAQQRVYGEDLRSFGRVGADRQTARPGYSEHQTGLADDLGAASGRCALAACFGRTREGRWIAAQAWRFGFVLRYPEGAEPVTGYEYEPWHVRYVGARLAAEVHARAGAPLETVLGLPPAPDYG